MLSGGGGIFRSWPLFSPEDGYSKVLLNIGSNVSNYTPLPFAKARAK
jgi:hypothetical protein